ncbi:MAG: DNA gyrase inhibitor YacG [Fuerstiella sp.]
MIKPHQCPVCDKTFSASEPEGAAQFPFCSSRCRQIDLFRWTEGRYAIVEDIDPMVAQFLKEDPDITVQGEGIEENE